MYRVTNNSHRFSLILASDRMKFYAKSDDVISERKNRRRVLLLYFSFSECRKNESLILDTNNKLRYKMKI